MQTPMQPDNGSLPTQTLNLGPNDKFVIILIDDATKQLQTIAPNINDELTVAGIMTSALASVLQVIAEKRKEAESKIVKPQMVMMPFRPGK